MSHVALYRKYRSQTFSELIGQDHVIRTLQNSIDKGRIHHAFLFTGPRGTGKTSTARLMAKALNCENGPTSNPCGECVNCKSIAIGNCLDVIEMDAASEAGVDQVRERIVDVVDYQPASCRYKVYIIDEVHDLSPKAFDALLKTIEEPPQHVVFILATTELHKVPPTIQSRCQRFGFNRGTIVDLSDRLKFVLEAEGREYEPAALLSLARLADGGFRDALSLLEQVMITTDGPLTNEHLYQQLGLIQDSTLDELLQAISGREGKKVIELLDSIYGSGRDARSILEGLLVRVSELTRTLYGVEVGSGVDSTREAATRATAASIGSDEILRIRSAVAAMLRDVREITLPKLWLESALLGIGLRAVEVTAPVTNTAKAAPKATAAVTIPKSESTPTVSAEPKAEPPAPKSEPAPIPVPEVKVNLTPEDAVWDKVVASLSAVSKVAATKLAKAKVVGNTESEVHIGFERRVDYDSVTSNSKLVGAIKAEWEKQRGPLAKSMQIVEQTAPKTKIANSESESITGPAVELPLEGQQLLEAAEQIFEGL